MDVTGLIIVIVLLLAVVLVIYYLTRGPAPAAPGPSGPNTATFVFNPGEEIGGGALVKRFVTISAPDQTGGAQPRSLIVDALPLPPDPTLPPPKGKGFDRLITSVIHPRVRYSDTLETVIDFDPPLTVAINYTKEDAETSNGPNDQSSMCVVTFYQEAEQWRWEKLETINDTAKMTLTGTLRTLHPKDPVGMGH